MRPTGSGLPIAALLESWGGKQTFSKQPAVPSRRAMTERLGSPKEGRHHQHRGTQKAPEQGRDA